jgi:hypothetical protein
MSRLKPRPTRIIHKFACNYRQSGCAGKFLWLALTTRARGVYNLVLLGGAILIWYPFTAQTARLETAAE